LDDYDDVLNEEIFQPLRERAEEEWNFFEENTPRQPYTIVEETDYNGVGVLVDSGNFQVDASDHVDEFVTPQEYE